MTLTRTLLASTAISLCSLGFSHAASFSQAQAPAFGQPASPQLIVRVQMSVGDAETTLQTALERKAEAESTGGDVAAAQAEVEAAQAGLEAAQAAAQSPEPAAGAAEEAPVEAAPAPAEEPAAPAAAPAEQPVSEPEANDVQEAPQPSSETAAPSAPEETAPEAEAAATGDAAAEAEQRTDTAPAEAAPATEAPEAPEQSEQPPAAEKAPEPTTPATENPSTTQVPEADQPEADQDEPAPESPTTEDPAAPAPAPADETSETDEPAGEAAPASETPAIDTGSKVAPQSESSAAAAPEPDAEADTAVESEEAAPEPKTEEADGTPEASDETTDQQTKTNSPASNEEEVLTLPVEDGAPVLDSAKEEPIADEKGTQPAPAAASSEPAPPPPASDAEAQAPASRSAAGPEAAMSERGERVNEAPPREAQTNVTIINQTDNRTIIEVDNRTVIEHDERERLRAGSEEVYYERLRGGRTREVIVRPNGVQLVTISNRWGDLIQRSRIMPDGQEYVLFYAEANSDGSREAFVDPGRNLPPLRLGIPIADYILDATDAEPSAYLNFLLEPPVEQVERLYSVEEVRRSARIRDKVRRVDMDSLTFEFGKATIGDDQIQRLSDVADAMTEILDNNPAETFLIEGHTDAVGRDESNLLLSDKRAETIAVALSDVFGIPPENLVTQGYGERFLKVRTEAPERLNRRVTIRRITPLVTPVASR